MTRVLPRVEECCRWCRRPINRCTEPACDDTGTYAGVLIRGEWRDVGELELQAAPLPAH